MRFASFLVACVFLACIFGQFGMDGVVLGEAKPPNEAWHAPNDPTWFIVYQCPTCEGEGGFSYREEWDGVEFWHVCDACNGNKAFTVEKVNVMPEKCTEWFVSESPILK